MSRSNSRTETAVGGNAHLPATEHPAEHRRPASAPPDEIDAINEKALAGGTPDAIERPYDPGGLSEVNDQPERRAEASSAGYDPVRDGPPHGIEGGPSVPNFDRYPGGDEPADTTGPDRSAARPSSSAGERPKPRRT